MARFRTVSACYVDYGCIGKIRGGSTVADSQAAAQSGDVVWPQLNSGSLPPGFIPLDAGATAIKAASPLANEVIRCCIVGGDSIG
jgi:hypothetical protein